MSRKPAQKGSYSYQVLYIAVPSSPHSMLHPSCSGALTLHTDQFLSSWRINVFTLSYTIGNAYFLLQATGRQIRDGSLTSFGTVLKQPLTAEPSLLTIPPPNLCLFLPIWPIDIARLPNSSFLPWCLRKQFGVFISWWHPWHNSPYFVKLIREWEIAHNLASITSDHD